MDRIVLLGINGLLCLVLPVAVSLWARRRLEVPLKWMGFGALTFVLSQVVHIPLNLAGGAVVKMLPTLPPMAVAVGVPLLLGLSAGVCEEGARYLMYRRWSAGQTVKGGLAAGIGHGGIEAFIVGVVALLGAVNVAVLMQTDLSTLPLTPEQLSQVQAQLDQVQSVPLPLLLAGVVERVFAMTCHVAMSLMVLQVFVRGDLRWLFASIGFHTAMNAVAVAAMSRVPLWATEILVGLFAVMAAGIIWRLAGASSDLRTA